MTFNTKITSIEDISVMNQDKFITHTRFAEIFDIEKQLRIVVDYLISNRTVIANKQDLSSIFSTRALSSTPISSMFERCISTGFINEFATILKIPDKSNVPDLITMGSIVVDFKQSNQGNPLKPFPELYQKILINISGLVKSANNGWYVSAIQEMHSMFIKGMLTRSYAMSKDVWLSPSHNQFMIRSYAMLISTIIARMTGLNYNELLNVAMVFALYMTQMLSINDRYLDKDPIPPSFYNQVYLGQRSDLIRFVDENREELQTRLDLNRCCKIISNIGSAKVKNYNIDLLYRQCSSLGSYIDKLTTMIALEYPPYWMWMILQTVSGAKLGNFGKILQQHNLMQGAKKFCNELVFMNNIYASR